MTVTVSRVVGAAHAWRQREDSVMTNGVALPMQTDIGSLRARVREDHQALRGLLVILAREATSACARNGGRAHVRLALTAVRDALSLHLDDEDREVVSRL